jgi:arsenate reductase
MADRMNILFICNHNANRSQMAEAWTNNLKSDEFEAFSAGTEPTSVDPRNVKVMAEAGIDISAHRSKGVEELGHMEFHFVVTLCSGAAENCPFFPAETRIVNHAFDDPTVLAAGESTEEAKLAQYRRVRDRIRAFVESFPGSLG